MADGPVSTGGGIQQLPVVPAGKGNDLEEQSGVIANPPTHMKDARNADTGSGPPKTSIMNRFPRRAGADEVASVQPAEAGKEFIGEYKKNILDEERFLLAHDALQSVLDGKELDGAEYKDLIVNVRKDGELIQLYPLPEGLSKEEVDDRKAMIEDAIGHLKNHLDNNVKDDKELEALEMSLKSQWQNANQGKKNEDGTPVDLEMAWREKIEVLYDQPSVLEDIEIEGRFKKEDMKENKGQGEDTGLPEEDEV